MPSMYKYNISSFKIVEESDIEIETKFEAVIGVNVCSEEGINKFLVEFEKSSATSYNVLYGDKKNWEKNCHIWI